MVTTYLKYTQEVLADFFKFQLLHKSNVKWLYFGLSAFCLALGMLEIFVWDSMTLGIIISVLSVALVLVFPLQIKGTVKKEVANMVNHIDIKLVFDNTGVRQEISEKRFAFDPWANFSEVIETKKYLYFYTNKYEAIIVTKALLKDGEREMLLRMATDHQVKRKVK